MNWPGAYTNKRKGLIVMLLAKVIGSVVSTVKDERLTGYKLLLVQPISPGGKKTGDTIIAATEINAGAGDLVMVVLGSAARLALNTDCPLDAGIIGILDRLEVENP